MLVLRHLQKIGHAPAVVLCDKNGVMLPGQEHVEMICDKTEPTRIVVTFIVDGALITSELDKEARFK